LLEALDRIMNVTRDLLCVIEKGEAEIALANSTVYLNLVGHTVIAWIWLRQALLAVEKLNAESPANTGFYQGKLQACTYFFRWELPKTAYWFQLLHDRDATCLEMQDAWF
jgi:butyryl-CoA dehydrogenase